MEFVICFGVFLAAAALAGNWAFEVILAAAAVQFVVALASVLRFRRQSSAW